MLKIQPGTPPSTSGRPGPGLQGRRRERGILDRLVGAVRAGESRMLAVRGEPGVGKLAVR